MGEQGMPPSAVLRVKDARGKDIEVASGTAETFSRADTLPRMAAARRLATADVAQARALAVDYQLMSPHTNCILVHERAEEDKAIGEAQLHQVSSMLAAGWGASSDMKASVVRHRIPTMWRTADRAVPRIQLSVSMDAFSASERDNASDAPLPNWLLPSSNLEG
jgi:hypothetical protein